MLSFEEILSIANTKNLSFPEAFLEKQSMDYGEEVSSIKKTMESRLMEMRHSVEEALCSKPSGKIVPNTAYKIGQYQEGNQPFSGKFIARACQIALAVATYNASMGRIVAAPTAGSCGILPGILFAAKEVFSFPQEIILEGLITAGGIGAIIASRATLAGAEGGCQAECGAASAMASGALTYMRGASVETVAHSAALVIKSILGLVCDPVAGLVEVPCIKRNGTLTSLAAICSDMASSGITSTIPPDEVVDAMYKVGRALPETLRETSLGGIAATPTALKITESLKAHTPDIK